MPKRKITRERIYREFDTSASRIKKKVNTLVKALNAETNRLRRFRDKVDMEESDEKVWNDVTGRIVKAQEDFVKAWNDTLALDAPIVLRG